MNKIIPADKNYFFLEYNLLNSYYVANYNTSNGYTAQLENDSVAKQSAILLFLIISAIFSFAAFIFLIPVYTLVSRNQEEIMKLFLEIPLAKVK